MQQQRRERLVRLLDEQDLDALVLRTPGDVAWAGDGARTHIDVTAPAGVAWLVVTRDGARAVTTVNEADRLREEELTDPALEWTVLPWADDLAGAVPSGERVGVDGVLEGRRDVSAAVEAARRALLPVEQDRYRALGRDTAEVLTDVCSTLGPGDPEQAWAAAAAQGLVARGADPLVVLVAGGTRLGRHRHPLPTAGPAGDLVMVVVCARRHGLIANATRLVTFGGAREGDLAPYDRLLAVEAAYLDATRPGTPVGEVFEAGTRAYAEHGFDADEWQAHHQGGPTGFASRDHLATAACTEPVEAGQAFAWNPSAGVVKVEDTVLAGDDGVEVLTVDTRWPTTDVAGRARPLVLRREG